MTHEKALEVPQRMHDLEINGEVNWFFDAGFEWTLWVRPPVSGEAQTHVEALTALAEAVCATLPEGKFAKWWRENP